MILRKILINTNVYQNFFTSSVTNLIRLKSTEVDKAKQTSQSQQKTTIFDKIISKEIPADIIFEDDKCLAFNDVNPQAPVHFLVIPKRRIPMLDSVKEDDKDILGELIICAQKLAQQRLPNGYRLVINNGKEGCQSVYHLHIHILGGRQLTWPPGLGVGVHVCYKALLCNVQKQVCGLFNSY